MGGDGTLVATPDAPRLVPPKKVEVVDATGAGDTFTGAFLAEWLAAWRSVPRRPPTPTRRRR